MIGLTAERERELAERMRAGDLAARDELFQLVFAWVLPRVRRYLQSRRIERKDVVQQAALIVLQELSKYDPSRGRLVRWSAMIVVRACVKSILRAGSPAEVAWCLRRRVLRDSAGGLNDRQIRRIIGVGSPEDWPDVCGESDLMLVDPRCPDPAVELADRDELEHANRVLACLDERRRDVLTRRIAGESLSTISARHKVSRERIRQLEVTAMKQSRALAGVN